MYINNPGHTIKMAAMPIYGKNIQKSSGTTIYPIMESKQNKVTANRSLTIILLIEILFQGHR